MKLEYGQLVCWTELGLPRVGVYLNTMVTRGSATPVPVSSVRLPSGEVVGVSPERLPSGEVVGVSPERLRPAKGRAAPEGVSTWKTGRPWYPAPPAGEGEEPPPQLEVCQGCDEEVVEAVFGLCTDCHLRLSDPDGEPEPDWGEAFASVEPRPCEECGSPDHSGLEEGLCKGCRVNDWTVPAPPPLEEEKGPYGPPPEGWDLGVDCGAPGGDLSAVNDLIDELKAQREQPSPTSDGLEVLPSLLRWLELDGREKLADLVRRRAAVGQQRYGTTLTTQNGRDYWRDLEDELGDALQYLWALVLRGEGDVSAAFAQARLALKALGRMLDMLEGDNEVGRAFRRLVKREAELAIELEEVRREMDHLCTPKGLRKG